MNSVAHTLGSPQRLFFQLTVVSLISTVVILLSAGYGINTLYEQYVVNSARNNAISLSQAFISTERSNLLKNFGLYDKRPVTEKQQLFTLDDSLNTFLSPYDILKIKVFSLGGHILYSTDHSIIGSNNTNNKRLTAALNGNTISQIQSKEQMLDLTQETRFDVDVVETYVPIYDKSNQIIGAFEIYQDMKDEYQQIHQGVILSVATLGLILLIVYLTAYYFLKASARRLLIAQKELAILATIDPVTNLFNRREILHRAESELERFSRESAAKADCSYSLLMVDIDYFKNINDSYGHPAGDAILSQVAQCIRGAMRNYCHIGRYGGEEFIAIIPDANQKGAEAIAERLLEAIREYDFNVEDTPLNITVSIGLAVTQAPNTNFDNLLLQADNFLYQAKEKGRDCFVSGLYKG